MKHVCVKLKSAKLISKESLKTIKRMNKDEVFLRQWFEILYSLTNPEANSDLRRINNEKGVEKVGQKRSAESRREGKKKRVKTQCVIKSSDKSDHDTLLKKVTNNSCIVMIRLPQETLDLLFSLLWIP